MKIEDVRIGASEMAKPLNLDDYESPYEWSLRKIGQHPDDDEDEDSEAARLGRFLEDGLARMFEDEHDVKLDPFVDGAVSFTHPDIPWMQCRPDRIVRFDDMTTEFRRKHDVEPGEDVLVEIKTYALAHRQPKRVVDEKWGTPGSDVIPARYATQVQGQMTVMDARGRYDGMGHIRRCLVRALIGGEGVREYVVNADLKVRGYITNELERVVHEHLIPEVPMPATTRDDFELMIKATRQPGHEKKITVPSTTEVDGLVAEWQYHKDIAEEAETNAARAKAAIIQWIGERYGVEGSWGKLLYTLGGTTMRKSTKLIVDDALALMTAESKSENYQRATLAKAFLDIVQKHTKKSTTGRALRLYPKKEGSK